MDGCFQPIRSRLRPDYVLNHLIFYVFESTVQTADRKIESVISALHRI
jgi:hypothetical protein